MWTDFRCLYSAFISVDGLKLFGSGGEVPCTDVLSIAARMCDFIMAWYDNETEGMADTELETQQWYTCNQHTLASVDWKCKTRMSKTSTPAKWYKLILNICLQWPVGGRQIVQVWFWRLEQIRHLIQTLLSGRVCLLNLIKSKYDCTSRLYWDWCSIMTALFWTIFFSVLNGSRSSPILSAQSTATSWPSGNFPLTRFSPDPIGRDLVPYTSQSILSETRIFLIFFRYQWQRVLALCTTWIRTE